MTGSRGRSGIVLLFAALAATGAARAAPAWVQVEVIAFAYTQADSETWAASPELPDLARASALQSAEPERDAPQPEVPVAYRALAPHELKLVGAYKLLARAAGMRPLLHLGWRQPGTDSRDVRLQAPMAVASDPRAAMPAPPPAVDGVLRVAPANDDAWRLTAHCMTYAGDTPIAFSETRRLTLDELHYLDHPLFGLLVQVTAVPLPDASAGTADGIAPAGDAGISPDALPD